LSAAKAMAGNPAKAIPPKSRRVSLLIMSGSMPPSLTKQRLHDKAGRTGVAGPLSVG
jgi:hypothetical protein